MSSGNPAAHIKMRKGRSILPEHTPGEPGTMYYADSGQTFGVCCRQHCQAAHPVSRVLFPETQPKLNVKFVFAQNCCLPLFLSQPRLSIHSTTVSLHLPNGQDGRSLNLLTSSVWHTVKQHKRSFSSELILLVRPLSSDSLWSHHVIWPCDVLFCKQQELERSSCEMINSREQRWHFTEILLIVIFVLSTPWMLSLKLFALIYNHCLIWWQVWCWMQSKPNLFPWPGSSIADKVEVRATFLRG